LNKGTISHNQKAYESKLALSRLALKRAALMGIRPNAWLTATVQANLERQPVMLSAELFALREASRELSAIGRNLNQIARALNLAAIAPAMSKPVDLSGLPEISDAVDRTKAEIRRLVRASEQVWALGEEE
jgi:Bacterial mobilisation protein (MobC)